MDGVPYWRDGAAPCDPIPDLMPWHFRPGQFFGQCWPVLTPLAYFAFRGNFDFKFPLTIFAYSQRVHLYRERLAPKLHLRPRSAIGQAGWGPFRLPPGNSWQSL